MTTLHTCGVFDAGAPQSRPNRVGANGDRALTIDMHCHVMTKAVEVIVADQPQKKAEPKMRVRTQGAPSAEFNAKVTLPAALPKLFNVEERLADMDAMGVDLQVVSPSPGQYYYWADHDLARDLVETQNEDIARICDAHPDRFLGLGNLALQHPDLAIEQLDYMVGELGLKGVEISTSVNDEEISADRFDKVWARMEALGCVVFIHPLGSSLGERMNRHYLQNIIGQPIETTIALSYLAFGGTLDRYPGLKICAAHGGGYFPTYPGRGDHAWAHRDECRCMQHTPGDYLKRIHFDSLVYSSKALDLLIQQVGAEQVVIGTDYPFDMGHYDIHGLVEGVPGLSEEDRKAVLGGNAARLLGIDPARYQSAS